MYVEDKVCDEGSSSSSASQPKEEEPMAPKSEVLGVMWRRKRTNNCSIAPLRSIVVGLWVNWTIYFLDLHCNSTFGGQGEDSELGG